LVVLPLPTAQAPQIVGRYALFEVIATGGMASVHLGRLMGQVGFARTVAIKRLHPNFACDPEFVAMLMDEARLAARIRHPNVVPTLDIVAEGKEVLLVMDYVAGESLHQLLRAAREAQRPPPIPVVAAIMVGVLNGLHAAHEATNESGEPLGIVHRDVSPHNILVGTDGVARVLDFGIAKAAGRMHQTRGAQVKGKLRYMPAEQMLARQVTRVADVYSASVVLWEALTGQRLFDGENDAQVMMQVLERQCPKPSTVRRDIPPALDAIVSRGLQRNPEDRFPTAKAMAAALENAVPPVKRSAVTDWVLTTVGDAIGRREARVAAVERSPSTEPSLEQVDQSSPGSGLLELPRRTLPAGVQEVPTSSHVGSVSRSVAPRQSSTSPRAKQLLLATGGAAAVLGLLVAWGGSRLLDYAPPSAVSQSSSATSSSAQLIDGSATPAPSVAPSAPPSPSVLSLDEPPAAAAASVVAAEPSSPPAAPKTGHAATRAKPVKASKKTLAPAPPTPARIYKRD
jgi:serine/threonine-protein kinase